MPAWLARLWADLQLVDAISELDGKGNDGDDARRSRQPVHCKYELMGNWEDDNNHSHAMALSALEEIAHEAELRLSRPVGSGSQLQPAGLVVPPPRDDERSFCNNDHPYLHTIFPGYRKGISHSFMENGPTETLLAALMSARQDI